MAPRPTSRSRPTRTTSIERVRRIRDGVEVSELGEPRTDEEIAQQDKDDEILTEARERFDTAYNWESDFMDLYVEDVKFANGDSDNGWQWPSNLWQERALKNKPSLTINKTANHVALVVNDAKQNKAGIDIRPAGGDSSFKAAQMYEGLIRNIEYRSSAQTIYDDAMESAVEGGIGYWRVVTEFSDDDSFDQECRISPVQSHMGVLLDPNIKQKSGLDAMFGFIFDSMDKREYKRQYKKSIPAGAALAGDMVSWFADDRVRIAEYYRILITKDELIWVREGDKEQTIRKSQCSPELLKHIRKLEKDISEDTEVRRRPIDVRQLQWFKIAGNEILERRDLKGQYVPIVRCVGKERVIDGKLERKGLVRALKDPQRMYNYNSSGQVEYGALATKSPWVADARAVSANINDWNNANVNNKAVLTYKGWDAAAGQAIPPPQKPEAPGTSPAFLTGMQIAAAELEMASGQGPAQFAKPEKERSGYAINQTKMQGELITYNFNDNLAIAIETTGVILLDMIRYTYDTKRVTQVLGKDGTEKEVQIDPKAETAYKENQLSPDEVEVLFNPTVGKYKVQARSGPAYATQRQEAWNAFVQIATGNPSFMDEFGDYMFQSADFPMSDEIAERYKRKLQNSAPWLLDENAPNQITQQLTQNNQQLQQALQALQKQLEDKTEELNLKYAGMSNDYRKTDIQAFDSHTKRIKEIGNAVDNLQDAGAGGGLELLIKQMITEALSDTANQDKRLAIPQESSADYDEDSEEDFHEPRKAPDGNYYVKVNGQYHQVNTAGEPVGQ